MGSPPMYLEVVRDFGGTLSYSALCALRRSAVSPILGDSQLSKYAIPNHFKIRVHDVKGIAKRFGTPSHDVPAIPKLFKGRWNEVLTPSKLVENGWKLMRTTH
jgi:hypothetical protein